MTLIWTALVVTFAAVIALTLFLGSRSAAFRDNQALRDAEQAHRRQTRDDTSP